MGTGCGDLDTAPVDPGAPAGSAVPATPGVATPGVATPGVAAYLRLLGHRPALLPLLAAFVARLPISMAPLGIVLLVSEVRGSYGSAGLVTGAFALGTAAGSPLWGRLLDRHGRRRVVAPTGIASGALLGCLTVGIAGLPLAAVVALAAAAGAVYPPVGPAMRASWRALFADVGSRRAGYALDAVSVESVFVGGPLLLSALLLAGPRVPLTVTAVLLVAGSVAFAVVAPVGSPATTGQAEQADQRSRSGRRSVLRAAGLAPVLGVAVAVSVAFGLLDTSIAATARDVLHDEGRVGILFAAIAGGSVSGGLFYGTRHAGRREHGRLLGTLPVFAVGVAVVALLTGSGAPPLAALLPLLFVAGLAIAPSLIILANLVDRFAPFGRANEAQAWNATATTSGAAAGTAVAGQVLDTGGVGWSFGGAACAVAVAVCLAAVAGRRWDRVLPAVPGAVVAPSPVVAPGPVVAPTSRSGVGGTGSAPGGVGAP